MLLVGEERLQFHDELTLHILHVFALHAADVRAQPCIHALRARRLSAKSSEPATDTPPPIAAAIELVLAREM